MGPKVSRFVRSSAALVALVALAGLGACDEQEAAPSGPEGQQPSFYHGDGLQEDETADSVKVVTDNISGDGSEVCNSGVVKDEGIVGDDEGTWSGRKIDPAEDFTGDGFTFDVRQGGKSLDWTEDGGNLMQAVVIKAGDNTVVYYYNEGDPDAEPDPAGDDGDSGLDGDDREISHYTYCFVRDPTAIEVTVLDVDGTPVSGHTVIATHSQNGPYRSDGTLQSATTNGSGLAVIGDLEPGDDYCVRSSPLGVPPGRVIPPSDPEDAPQLASVLGTAVSGDPDFRGAPLTLDNYKAECLNDPDSEPDKPRIQPGDAVTLDLQDGPGAVSGSFETFGETNSNGEVSGWLVADLTNLVPWANEIPSTSVADTKIGLFVTGARDNNSVAFSIETPGGSSIIESDLVSVGGGFLTASASTSGAGSVDPVARPQYCVTNSTEEDLGDGGRVDFDGPYLHGFLADADLNVSATSFGVAYAQTAGPAKFKLRAVSNNKKSLQVDYECFSDGTCRVDKTSGALANQVDVTLRSALTPETDDELVLVRILVSGLPSNLDAVQTALSAPNDNVPDSSRDDNNDGFVEALLQSTCTTEGSRWVLGG